MKIYYYFVALFLSQTILASGICVTHGQCQSVSDETTACFQVRVDKSKNAKCESRCFTVYAGSYCDFIPGKKYGTCRDENYKQSDIDTTCENAIPLEIANDL